VPSRKWLEVKWELLEKIKKALDEAGVEIPFPQRVVWLRSVEPAGVQSVNGAAAVLEGSGEKGEVLAEGS
jgi:small-conductance mechanosensitive channel